MYSLRAPAEHGAWGILLVPLATAAAVAGAWNLPLGCVTLAALALFLLRGSLEAHGTWRAITAPAHLVLAAAALTAVAILLLVFERWALVWLAVPAAALYLAQLRLAGRHRAQNGEKRSLPAEIAGTALLTLAAPAAWIAARSQLDRTGAALWLLNFLFFAGGVLYVKYRVRGVLAHRSFAGVAERVAFAWPVFVYHLLLAAFLLAAALGETLSAAVVVAFVPGVLRALALAVQLGRRFPIRRLGWTEVTHAVAFGVLLVLALRL
jgi:hypothetical protein